MPDANHLLKASFDGVASPLLVLAWLVAFWRMKRSPRAIAFFALGGTALHELAHLLIGILFNARPVSMSIVPKKEGSTWVLGSVGFEHVTWWNAPFVAYAPLLLLPLGGIALRDVLPLLWDSQQYGKWWLSSYLVACCFQAFPPSQADIRLGGVPGLALLVSAIWLVLSNQSGYFVS